MERAIGVQRNLLAWGGHLTRAFLDMSPAAQVPVITLVLLIPIVLGLLVYLVWATRPAMWLLPTIAAVYLGVVLGPDLLLGGSRSLHVRYGIPAVTALQLMVAWAIGAALSRPGTSRAIGVSALALAILFGLSSQWRILHAETWWTKQFSAGNVEVARLVNALDRLLVVVSPSGVAVGELVSLAYYLDDEVRIWGHETAGEPVVLPSGFDRFLLLLPSSELRAAVPSGLAVEPIEGTWQWFLARP